MIIARNGNLERKGIVKESKRAERVFNLIFVNEVCFGSSCRLGGACGEVTRVARVARTARAARAARATRLCPLAIYKAR